jgi:UDPglucose 6-dehydrogenase
VRAFDPQAMNEAARAIPELVLCKDVYETCEGGDVLVIATEWNQFRMLDFARVKDLLNEPIMVDLRNIYRADAMNSAGFSYLSVGR